VRLWELATTPHGSYGYASGCCAQRRAVHYSSQLTWPAHSVGGNLGYVTAMNSTRVWVMQYYLSETDTNAANSCICYAIISHVTTWPPNGTEQHIEQIMCICKKLYDDNEVGSTTTGGVRILHTSGTGYAEQ
jgi:hypothetical protein